MSTLPAVRDFIYRYKPRANDDPAFCRIRLYEAPTGDLVVVCTELPSNPGMSITNAAEEIATAIYQEYGQGNVEPDGLVWIEHYPERLMGSHGLIHETYDAVTFRWRHYEFRDPEWRRLSGEELSFLTGGVLTL